MKKQNFKNYLKLGILLFGISIFIFNFSCQKEDTLQENENSSKLLPNFSVKIISAKHLFKNNIAIKNQIDKFQIKSTASRGLESNQYGFSIDTLRVQEITTDNYISYTFLVDRAEYTPNILENYTYKVFNDGTYEQLLLTYHYTIDDDGEIIYNTDILEIETIIDESLIYNREGCVPELVDTMSKTVCVYHSTCYGPGSDGRHEVGDDCRCQDPIPTCFRAGTTACETTTVYTYSCGNTSTTTDPNDPETTTAGSGTNNGEGNSFAIPLNPSPYAESILNCINGSSIGQTDNTTIDPNILNSVDLADQKLISAYLNQNGCSEEAQEQAIEDLLDLDQHDKNCEELQKLSQTDELSANINPIVAELKNRTGLENEYSISYRKNINGGEEYNMPDNAGILEGDSQTGARIKWGTTWFGGIHTHPEGTIFMFSWLDVSRLKIVYDNLHPDFNKEDVFMMIVNDDGTVYALKINDITALTDKLDVDLQNIDGNTLEEKEENLNDKLTNEYNKEGSNWEKVFLKKFNTYGISLYKANDENLSNWSELKLNDPTSNNPTVITTPCN